MTQYTLRTTIAVPEPLISAANQLALAIGESRSDDQTFTAADYEDADGNRYAVASAQAVETFPDIAASSLEAAAIERFGDDHPVDLTLAQQAQALIAIDAPADPSRIAVSLLPSVEGALLALGLTRVSERDLFLWRE